MVTKVEQFIQIMESKIKNADVGLYDLKRSGIVDSVRINPLITRKNTLNNLLSVYKNLNDR